MEVMLGLAGQFLWEWREASKTEMLDPAFFDYANADSQKAWMLEQNKRGSRDVGHNTQQNDGSDDRAREGRDVAFLAEASVFEACSVG